MRSRPNSRRAPTAGAALLTAGTALFTAGAALYACTENSTSPVADGMRREYGAPVAVGNGHARTYVVLDTKAANSPVEVGVALDEAALEGLPTPMAMPASGAAADPHAHVDTHPFDLAMPAGHGTPYRFVELDWNPAGHEPPGIYDVPHFDVHFYTIAPAQRDAIDPVALGDTQYSAKSNRLPPEAERPASYAALGAPGQPLTAVPHMGVHWADVRSPELQGAFGHPEHARPFVTTFLHGSWDGDFIFDEPMVTRAFILGRKAATAAAARDSVVALPAAQRYRPSGAYPDAYHVTYDAQAKEYHVGLTRLARRG